jgi:hypothetical protein
VLECWSVGVLERGSDGILRQVGIAPRDREVGDAEGASDPVHSGDRQAPNARKSPISGATFPPSSLFPRNYGGQAGRTALND